MIMFIGKIVLRILASTWRYTFTGEQVSGNLPCVIAFWHEHMLAGWHAHKHKHSIALVSRSKDGEILSDILNSWGIQTIRGSSSQSGTEALAKAVDYISKGHTLLITPDGPRGPRHIFKPGAVVAAIRAEVPLYLAHISEEHYHVFHKSWDHFRLPLPFTRIHISYTLIETSTRAIDQESISSLILESQLRLQEQK